MKHDFPNIKQTTKIYKFEGIFMKKVTIMIMMMMTKNLISHFRHSIPQ